MYTPVVLHTSTSFERRVRLITVVKNRFLSCHMVHRYVIFLPVRRVHLITVVKNRLPLCHMVHRYVIFLPVQRVSKYVADEALVDGFMFFLPFLYPIARKYTSVLRVGESFILVHGLLISLLLMFFSI